MRLLSASALWWLLLGAVIIFFYLLKLKRKRRVVPSAFLWQRALEEIEANAPFRKLRRSLLLLLQLLALAALALTIARPLVNTRSLASGSTIIIIDTTASMSARDENGQTRLERAKEIAREMISTLSGNDRAAIIESSSRVAVRAAITSDRAALASAINDVRESDAAGNISDAVRLAEQIAKPERDASIVIIGDGGGPPLNSGADLPAADSSPVTSPSIPIRFVRVGRRADNLGIIAMNSRPVHQSNRREMFASIANFSPTDRAIGLELRIDGKLVDARTVNVAANDRAAVIFDALPQTGGLAELRLAITDDLASDNLAYTLLPDASRLRVGVATDNPFLLQALAVNPDLDVHKINASADAQISDNDCMVIEGALPAGAIESNKPLLAINPSDAGGLWQASGQIEQPAVSSVNRSHPVNAYLSYSDLHVESTTDRNVARWLRPIVTSGDNALIWAGNDGTRRVIMLGFDLAKSDLPLKVEFPLLLANSISWLTGRDAPTTERAVRAGQPITISTNSPTVSLTAPDGDTREVEARDGLATFADTMNVGLYTGKDAPPIGVSLLSESESDTTPRDSIKTRAGQVSGQATDFFSEREAWAWVALLALAVLTVEWWVYHRRIAA